MELLQLERMAVDGQRAARRVADLHGVSVVDDVRGARLVTELQRLQVGLDEAAEIDRRLVAPHAAHRVLLVELRPVLGAGFTLVAPMLRMGCRKRTDDQSGAQKEGTLIHVSGS